MPNWDRNPPVSGMSVEEMKKRMAAGNKVRIARGEMHDPTLKRISLVADGPTLDKKQRTALVAATDLAIYSLANNEREDYCMAADGIRAVCAVSGFGKRLFAELLKGCAEQAAELAGEDFTILDGLARAWLADYFTPSGKLISITRGQPDGIEQKSEKDQP